MVRIVTMRCCDSAAVDIQTSKMGRRSYSRDTLGSDTIQAKR